MYRSNSHSLLKSSRTQTYYYYYKQTLLRQTTMTSSNPTAPSPMENTQTIQITRVHRFPRPSQTIFDRVDFCVIRCGPHRYQPNRFEAPGYQEGHPRVPRSHRRIVSTRYEIRGDQIFDSIIFEGGFPLAYFLSPISRNRK